MRNCIDEGSLQAWFDGELSASEAANVAAHVYECTKCSLTANTVEAENQTLAGGLSAEFAAAVPTERLRERIEVAVAGLHRGPRAVRRSRWNGFIELFGSFRPLAYASIAAIILLAGLVAFVYLKKEKAPPMVSQNPREVIPATPKESANQLPAPSPAQSPQLVKVERHKPIRRSPAEPDAISLAWQEHQYQYAIGKLNEAIKIQPPMRPSLQVEYEYNMALIDNAIATSRHAAKKNPNDLRATQSMLAAYQSKVDLMNQVADARVLE